MNFETISAQTVGVDWKKEIPFHGKFCYRVITKSSYQSINRAQLQDQAASTDTACHSYWPVLPVKTAVIWYISAEPMLSAPWNARAGNPVLHVRLLLFPLVHSRTLSRPQHCRRGSGAAAVRVCICAWRLQVVVGEDRPEMRRTRARHRFLAPEMLRG